MSTILIVDDDENCAKLWHRVLEGMADKFITAASLEMAIARMGDIPPPDLVLLDLKLPPYDAEHTLSAVAALREFNPSLKVIAISGMTEAEIDAAIASTGAAVQAVVRKGDMESQSNLLAAVRGLLSTGSPKSAIQTVQDAIDKKRTDKINLEGR